MAQNKLPSLLVVAALIFLGVLLPSCASQKKEEAQEVIIKGMVKIYGSEPHTRVGIETQGDGKIYMVQPQEKATELRSKQGRLLEFTVTLGGSPTLGIEGTATVISWRDITFK